MKRTPKIELYIISSAVVLALFIIGLFWMLNQGETPTKSPLNQTASTSMVKPVMPETTADPIKGGQETVAPVVHQGLAKLSEPTTVSALVLGDSVAESQGASNKDQSSWYTLVANDLHVKYPGTLQWHFKTSAKATVNDVLKYVPEVTQDTDLIVLCLGRNDFSKVKLTEFKQKYDQLLVELKAKSPHADLFLVVEPPLKNNLENNRYFPYRKIIMDLGQKHQLPIIDEWTAYIKDPTPLSGLLADGVNPNDKGYQIFADEVLKRFEDYLSPAN